ncbi:MAG: divergent PAP2 family protein [Oscillospiraceae bacterium]|jgi:acid phosphatase family membrane protein YuiD|nr:divergent PAP2 family protein [Oscillospiraceae bacterium]
MPDNFNVPLTAAVLSWFIAQLIKILDYIFRNKKINPERLWGAGGMPSSHSAAVCALAAALGMTAGWNSPVFALGAVLALIVMYDASGVRRAAGMHAREINKIKDIIEELDAEAKTGIEAIGDINKENIEEKKEHLKEFLGHSPLEVLFGALVGITVGTLASLL